MRKLTTALAALALVGTLAACGNDADSAATSPDQAIIQVGSVYEPQNLDNTAGGGHHPGCDPRETSK